MVDPKARLFLFERSLAFIRAAQTPDGGFIACPSYPTYRYVWARDGAFTAEAMRAAGQADCALAFHRFMATAVLALAGPAGEPPAVLPARFELNGGLDRSGWPNFQVDGYGLWLWALRRQDASGSLGQAVAAAAETVARYLAVHWSDPCHDPWEEGGESLPVATLAASVAGLRAATAMLGAGPWRQAATDAWHLLLQDGVEDGRLRKDVGVAGGVDAATLWALAPLGLFAPDDPIHAGTVFDVERRLMAPNVHRHPGDEYYGGGAWPILSALWGLARLEAGDRRAAECAVAWIETTAAADGAMPEQVPEPMLHPDHLARWVAERGPVATPLTWSHAMYVLLALGLTGTEAL